MDLTGLFEKKGHKGTVYYENEDGAILAKVCRKCSDTKSLDDYVKKKDGLGGCSSVCKKCGSEKHRNWYQSNRDTCIQKSLDWERNNKERKTENRRKWAKANKEKQSEKMRKWVENNRELVAEYSRNWLLKNPDKKAIIEHRRRARKLALLDDFNLEQMSATLTYFNEGCALTGHTVDIHWDHVIPLATGHVGTTYGNMIPLRGDHNISKSDANIFEWFAANRDRFGLEQAKFDALIEYLADINEMTVEEYRDYVYWCHANPRTIEDLTELNASGNRSTDDSQTDSDYGNSHGEVS